jgi:hypothetical protein
MYIAIKEFCEDEEMKDSEIVSVSVIETNKWIN